MEPVFLPCCAAKYLARVGQMGFISYLHTQTVSFLDALPPQISSTICCYRLPSFISCCDYFKRFCVSKQKSILQDLDSATEARPSCANTRTQATKKQECAKPFGS